MGTNYYTRKKECKECGRYEKIHLGKSSFGWQFSFQYNGGQYYKNLKEMKEWLKGRNIWDEYSEQIMQKDFWKMIKEKQIDTNSNHASENPSETEKVIDGYSFSDTEFS